MAVQVKLNQDNETETLDQPSTAAHKGEVKEDLSNISHKLDFDRIKVDAEKYGNEDGKGKKAFVAFARRLVEGGSEGVLTNSRDTEFLVSSGGKDKPKRQAAYLYDVFTGASRAASGNVRGEESTQSYNAQVSKFSALIKLGVEYKEDAIAVFERAKNVHKAIVSDAKLVDRVKYKSTYTALVTVAVAQCRRVKDAQDKMVKAPPFSEQDIRNVLLSDEETKVVTSAMLIMQAVKLLEAAMTDRPQTDTKDARAAALDSNNHMPAVLQALYKIATDTDARDNTTAVNDFEAAKAEKAKKKAQAEENKKIKAAADEKRKADKEAKERADAAKAVSAEIDEDNETEIDEEIEGLDIEVE